MPLWRMWENVSKAQLTKLRSVEIRPVQVEDPPVVAFALMDAAEAHRIGESVNSSLGNLQRVINGSGLSTPEIQAQARMLVRNEVPDAWCATWAQAPEDATVFLQGLAKRITALKSDWVQRVKSPNNMFDKPVALSDFLRPSVFLNALRQQTARKLGASMDSLHLVASFEPHLLSDASISPLSVTIEGLILEGCVFDEQRKLLIEGNRTSPLTSMLPPLVLAWTSKQAQFDRALSSQRQPATIAMPIYSSLSREYLVGEVVLHTESSRQRVLNSAALFLSETN